MNGRACEDCGHISTALLRCGQCGAFVAVPADSINDEQVTVSLDSDETTQTGPVQSDVEETVALKLAPPPAAAVEDEQTVALKLADPPAAAVAEQDEDVETIALAGATASDEQTVALTLDRKPAPATRTRVDPEATVQIIIPRAVLPPPGTPRPDGQPATLPRQRLAGPQPASRATMESLPLASATAAELAAERLGHHNPSADDEVDESGHAVRVVLVLFLALALVIGAGYLFALSISGGIQEFFDRVVSAK
jgi:hypothetical protein